jgi:hypothetical protein
VSDEELTAEAKLLLRASKLAARRCYDLAMRCDPIPEETAEAARLYIDHYKLRDPYNAAKTLDGRGVLDSWGERELRKRTGGDVVLHWA